jgi:catechol 2,3-dioxygenase-like lactoylglutathione lyase family enzyme
MKLAMLMLLTPDLDEARRFYGEVLGFRIASGDDRRLSLQHDGAAFEIFRCERAAPPADHGDAAASVFVFGVEDIDAAIAELTAKGVRFIHQRPAQTALGRYAAFHAPGGNIHELFEAAR